MMNDFKLKDMTSLKVAFTIAEVLIVLSIIGIIADMTIPTLVANVQKERTVTTLKKAYSDLSQALKLAELDNGMMDSWSLGTSSLAATQAFADGYFYPYIKTIRKCAQGETGCWTPSVSIDNTANTYATPSYANAISAVMPSGYSVLFYASGTAGVFWVDVNGPEKGKNKLGKDVFVMRLQAAVSSSQKQGIHPFGLASIPSLTREQLKTGGYGCVSTATGAWAGGYCGALIVLDGWKIPDDYP